MSEKKYTEVEIAALLNRAAKLQASDSATAEEGLTLDEVKQAAAEAGIDPRYVEIASATAADHRQDYAGIAIGLARSLVVPGQLTDGLWDQMVTVFTREFESVGATSILDGRREWTSAGIRIFAEQSDDKILLRAETRWESELELPIATLLVGAVIAITTGAAALASVNFVIGIISLISTLLVAVYYSAYRKRTRQRRQDIQTRFAAALDGCASVVLSGDGTDVQTRPIDTSIQTVTIAIPERDEYGSEASEDKSGNRDSTLQA